MYSLYNFTKCIKCRSPHLAKRWARLAEERRAREEVRRPVMVALAEVGLMAAHPPGERYDVAVHIERREGQIGRSRLVRVAIGRATTVVNVRVDVGDGGRLAATPRCERTGVLEAADCGGCEACRVARLVNAAPANRGSGWPSR